MPVKKISTIRNELMDFTKFKETREISHTPLSQISRDWHKRRKQYFDKYKEDCIEIVPEIDRWQELATSLHKSLTFEQLYEVYRDSILRSEIEPLKFEEAKDAHRDFLSTKVKSHGPRWAFKGYIYEVNGAYTHDQVKLLILEEFDKERRKFEKLGLKFDSNEAEEQDDFPRPRIPEKVRIEVWRRDGGKCARCGSREKLEYDHIVPISKGGSNTARNIELLCEKHNRSKGNSVV